MKRMTKKMLLGLNRELEQQLKGQENHKAKNDELRDAIKALEQQIKLTEASRDAVFTVNDTLRAEHEALQEKYDELVNKHHPELYDEALLARVEARAKPAVEFARVQFTEAQEEAVQGDAHPLDVKAQATSDLEGSDLLLPEGNGRGNTRQKVG